MLISENLLDSLLQQMRVTDTFGSLLFQWNNNQNCFQLKSKPKTYLYKARFLTSGIFAFLVFSQLLWTWRSINIFVKLHSMFNFCAILLHLYTHFVFYTNSKLIVSYLNGMLEFENRRNGNHNSSNSSNSGSKITKAVMKIMEISCVTLPLLYHADLIRNPCLPIHLGGYWIVNTQCGGQIGTDLKSTWSVEEIQMKSVVFLISYFNWSFLLSGSYFHMTLVLLLKSYCLKKYILLAGQKISKGKSNWHTCLMYREIEVMSTEYRRLYSCYMTSDVLVSVMFVHTISLYACFNFGIELPLSMFFMLMLAAVNAGVVLVCMYTSLANVFTVSQFVLKIQLKGGNTNGVVQPSAWFRRYLRSCKIIRIYIGYTNFVEPLTPLTVEQFSIEQTISLMLVKN